MRIKDYQTASGKNLIKEYLSALPKTECEIGYHLRHEIVKRGTEALKEFDTRQIRDKLWEIKFYNKNRIFYVVIPSQAEIYFLHACKKQKGKAEKFELETALSRMKEFGL